MQIFRITYTYHFSFSKCQRHYFACISTHTEFVWRIQDSPELPYKCRSWSVYLLIWNGFDIYSSAIYVLQVQHRSNWQFSRKSAQRRWKVACSLPRWRETGIWKRNKNLKAPQRDEDLVFSKRLFQICFFQQESKK